jgi:hypothetical protein
LARPWLGVVIRNSPDAVLQDGDIEIDQQPDLLVGGFQIGQQLGRMDGQDLLNGFELHDDCVLHQQINPIIAVQLEPLVTEGQMDLASKGKTHLAQFIANAFLICRFQ